MARYDRVIPPGKEGKVELEVKTENLRGEITKGIMITTNNKDREDDEIITSFASSLISKSNC